MGLMFYVVQNAAADRDQAFRTLQIQQTSNQQQRALQTRRIDLLQERIGNLTIKVEDQALLIGDQSRQIVVLTEQLRRVGVKPVTKGR